MIIIVLCRGATTRERGTREMTRTMVWTAIFYACIVCLVATAISVSHAQMAHADVAAPALTTSQTSR